MTTPMKCGHCNNIHYTLETRSAKDSSFLELRLQCTGCKSVSFWKPQTVIEMDWSGSGYPVSRLADK